MYQKNGFKNVLFFSFALLILHILLVRTNLSVYRLRKNSLANKLRVPLPEFEGTKHFESKQIFFLETSGRSYLRGRECRSIESAARNSGLKVQVLFTSRYLDLSMSNCTAELYGGSHIIHFYTVNISIELKGTSVETLVNRLNQYKYLRSIFLSDILRVVLVYKYGGFYSDLDTVVIRNMENLSNVVGCEHSSTTKRLPGVSCLSQNGSYPIRFANNAQFHLEKGHKLSEEMLREMKKVFNGKGERTQIGPPLIQKTMEKVINTRRAPGSLNGRSQLSVLPFFAPVGWSGAGDAYWRRKPYKSTTEWDDLFSCSYAVHFYNHLTRHKPVRGNDPLREAYSYLAPKHCPISWQPASQF